jgi:hypothetical protein
MRNILLIIFCICVSVNSYAQADFIELGNRQYNFLDRLEIKLQRDSVFNFSFIKPYDRQTITKRLEYVDSLVKNGKLVLSKVDKYNLDLALKNNFEWRSSLKGDTSLKFKNLWGKEHLTNPFYFGVKRGDFSFYSQFMYNFQMGKESDRSSRLYHNTRGLFQWRGQVSKKIGYYTYATDNQLRLPLHARQFVDANSAVPGLGYFKGDKSVNSTAPFDLFEVRGGIMFNAAKGIDMQFAMDKVFMGNGYRSLIMSDFSNNFLFFKINTRFWKINYSNLYGQMINRFDIPQGVDTAYPKKFITMHTLDIQATKWLNIGLFENIVFGRQDGRYDLAYLNPMIFMVGLGHQLGSPDKATIGMNIKANIAKKHQLYSQIIINEFVGREILRYGNGFWANKQALQLGIKSIDVLGISNLDVQAELNIVRPFVYTSKDNYSSFTHYNQALAHPLGANFKEYIGIVRYQPIPKLLLQGKLIYFQQGADSAGTNNGSNIFLPYSTRPRDYGWFVGTGVKSTTVLAKIGATYELLPNIFLDADYIVRRNKLGEAASTSNSIFNVGFRMNLRKREFDF